jgi:hypothetical protein
MPIGFPAYTEKTIKYRGSSRKELARAAEDALDELGWNPLKDGKWRIRALVPMGFYIIFLTWGARFTVEIEEERLHLRSEGAFPLEWLDVGQHGENIKRFLDRFEDILDDQG